MKFLRTKFTVVALILLVPAMLSASAIGSIDFSGLGQVFVTATTIDFSPDGNPSLGVNGTLAVTDRSGDFLAVPLLSVGSIGDITGPVPPTIDPWILIPDPGTIFSFNLENLPLSSAPVACTPLTAAGVACSVGIFTLTQNGVSSPTSTVTASFTANGIVTHTGDGDIANYNGLFSANLALSQFNTIAEVLAAIAAGGAVNSSWSASLVSTPIPEPTSFLLIGGALVGLAGLRLRRPAKN